MIYPNFPTELNDDEKSIKICLIVSKWERTYRRRKQATLLFGDLVHSLTRSKNVGTDFNFTNTSVKCHMVKNTTIHLFPFPI